MPRGRGRVACYCPARCLAGQRNGSERRCGAAVTTAEQDAPRLPQTCPFCCTCTFYFVLRLPRHCSHFRHVCRGLRVRLVGGPGARCAAGALGSRLSWLRTPSCRPASAGGHSERRSANQTSGGGSVTRASFISGSRSHEHHGRCRILRWRRNKKAWDGGEVGCVWHQMLIEMVVKGDFVACTGTPASVSPLSKLLSCVYLVNNWLQLLMV